MNPVTGSSNPATSSFAAEDTRVCTSATPGIWVICRVAEVGARFSVTNTSANR